MNVQIDSIMRLPLLGSLALALTLLMAPGTASAFSTQSSVRDACHESMTFAAIDSAGWPDGQAPPPMSSLARRMANDLPFDLPPQQENPWSLAMAMGNRHVDLRGHSLDDMVAFAVEQAKPERQPEHCLRMPEHDGPDGNAQAVQACRDFILEMVGKALGPGSTINLTTREAHEITFDFAGPVETDVPRYAFRMGMALHAVQDGFSHMLRTDDGMRVIHVLNYSEWAQGEGYSEAEDGHRHESHLDRCGESDPADQRQRVEWAAQASAELLAAVNDPSGGRDGRIERAEAVLDRWFTYEEGCTVENDYCDSPGLEAPASGCNTNGTAPAGGAGWALLPLLAGALLLARRRARGLGRAAGLGAALVAATLIGAPTAQAQEPELAGTDEPSEAHEEAAEEDDMKVVRGTERDGQAEVVERRQVDAGDLGAPVNRGFGFKLNLGGTIDEAGGFAGIGFRVDLADWLTLGADVEYNPWFSVETGNAAEGVSNAFITGIFTWGVMGPLELRTTLQAGVTMLMYDSILGERYTVGPIGGLTPLGVAFRATEGIRVTLDPGGIYISQPNTRAAAPPRTEHRFAVGLRFTP